MPSYRPRAASAAPDRGSAVYCYRPAASASSVCISRMRCGLRRPVWEPAGRFAPAS